MRGPRKDKLFYIPCWSGAGEGVGGRGRGCPVEDKLLCEETLPCARANHVPKLFLVGYRWISDGLSHRSAPKMSLRGKLFMTVSDNWPTHTRDTDDKVWTIV